MGITSFALEVTDLSRSQNAEVVVCVLKGGGGRKGNDQGDLSLLI